MHDESPRFGVDDVEVIDETVDYQGFFRLNTYRLKHRLIEGGWSHELRRECFMRSPAVAVLLYDPIVDSVILIEQFRVGALWESSGPWMTELVAGIVEDGEENIDVARREVMEESGCQLSDLEHICDYLPSPGASNEKITLYVGRVDSKGVGGRHGLASEGEDIWARAMTRVDAWQALKDGYINNAATIIALQWLELNYGRLHTEWK